MYEQIAPVYSRFFSLLKDIQVLLPPQYLPGPGGFLKSLVEDRSDGDLTSDSNFAWGDTFLASFKALKKVGRSPVSKRTVLRGAILCPDLDKPCSLGRDEILLGFSISTHPRVAA